MSQSDSPVSAPWEGLRVSVRLDGRVVALEGSNLRVHIDGGLGEVLVDPSRCTGIQMPNRSGD